MPLLVPAKFRVEVGSAGTGGRTSNSASRLCSAVPTSTGSPHFPSCPLASVAHLGTTDFDRPTAPCGLDHRATSCLPQGDKASASAISTEPILFDGLLVISGAAIFGRRAAKAILTSVGYNLRLLLVWIRTLSRLLATNQRSDRRVTTDHSEF